MNVPVFTADVLMPVLHIHIIVSKNETVNDNIVNKNASFFAARPVY